MILAIPAGTTSKSIPVNILDSSVTTGAGLTGLAFNTASLIAYYWREAGSPTAITLATLAAINSAWSSGGFKEADATNAPGAYRLDVPDAALASGAKWCLIRLQGATNMAQATVLIQLDTAGIRRNIAYSGFVFMLTDATTHAPKTGVSSFSTTQRSIDGAGFGNGGLSAISEIANGLYKLDLAAADLNGTQIVLLVQGLNCDPMYVHIFPSV